MTKAIFLFSLFLAFEKSSSQDIITLRTGDELIAKVLEVQAEQVKYKKWGNLNGPIYTVNKIDVFMIKYKNGTKDVFSNSSSAFSNIPQAQTINGNKFLGIWYHKSYEGNNNKTTLTITKIGQDFLIDYVKRERGGGYDFMYNADGSFKETGHIEGHSIVINSDVKLSFLNDSTILMASKEFVKTPLQPKPPIQPITQKPKTQTPVLPVISDQEQKALSHTSELENRVPGIPPNYRPYYNNIDSIRDYNVWDNFIFYKSTNLVKIKTVELHGLSHTLNKDDLTARVDYEPVSALITTDWEKRKSKKYSYTISLCITDENGEVLSKRENIEQTKKSEYFYFYPGHVLHGNEIASELSHRNVFLNFEVKDSTSNFLMQGFFKIKFIK